MADTLIDTAENISKTKDLSGVKEFFESPFIPGVGKVYAEKIVENLGDRLSEIETLSANDYHEIAGISESLSEEIAKAIKNLSVSPYLLILLFSSGLSYIDIQKIIKKYGPLTEKVVTENPYDMVEDVWKFSFFKADKIGRKLDIAKDDPGRLRGALLTGVKLIAEKGSLFARKDELINLASSIAHVDTELVAGQIPHLIAEERLIESMEGIYLPVFYNAERETAEKLSSIIKSGSDPNAVKFDLPRQDLDGHFFTEEQLEAIRLVRDNPVSIITGDPGTGKTTTVRGLIKLFEDEGKKVILTAPTGRSTKKLEMTAGSAAKTMHRILGFRRGKGYFHRKLDADVLIIDEASLLEQVLFNHLLDALPEKIKIVLVGDVGQLPPIGAGKVLEDLIDSGVVPTARLTHNFRQEAGSALALNIQKVKKGEMPESSSENDFTLITANDPATVRDNLLGTVTQFLPGKYGVDPSDIQVVTPQNDGILGAFALNDDLQCLLRKDAPEIKKGIKKFRLGDRVVQKENSARRGVFNGETGKIVAIDTDNGSLTVEFSNGQTSVYSSGDLGELTLAYATSVHKLQGTETDFVVMPLTMEHERMLYRNLLFTAVSRAGVHCVLIAEPEALRKAIETPAPYARNSNLKARLCNLLKDGSDS